MSLVYNSNKFQYAVSQSLPFGEVRRGFPFNAFNCMKAYSFNGERYGYYGYDASGERTYKYGLDRIDITTNQGDVYVTETYWEANEMMFYPNGYINMNQNGEYTKHYYADALRIASKIGSGKSGLDLCSEAMAIENAYPDYLTDRINEQYEQMKEELWELVPGSEYIVDITPIPYPNFCDIGPGGQESALFFYHPDHLGSTGMVTDNISNYTQGMLYAPFGEIICDYNPTFHDSPMPNYAFNAKELDEENNMYYYSARYYAPPTFISRDVLFEKYPSINPYSYCSNSPVNRIDPNGEDDYEVNRKTGEITFLKETVSKYIFFNSSYAIVSPLYNTFFFNSVSNFHG
jgi:RHS repeat-associated protein